MKDDNYPKLWCENSGLGRVGLAYESITIGQ